MAEGMPPPMQSSAAEIAAFLAQLKNQAEVTDFMENLGQDLLGSGVLREADFGKKPTSLQLSKLKAKFRESKVYVGDVQAGAEWKDKKDEWWDEHGAPLVLRIQDAWKAQAGGTGTITEALIRGQVLSRPEVKEIVQDAKMPELEALLAAQDVAQIKVKLASASRFGALFQRGWVNFKEASGDKGGTDATDPDRMRLNVAFLAYSRMWTGKILPELVADRYARRLYYPPKFFEQVHVNLTAFAAGKEIEEGLLAAMTLLADKNSVKELGSCGVSTLSKALGSALAIYDAMLDDVGTGAGLRAQEVLDVWTADPHWEHYSTHYQCVRHEEPLACVRAFVIPVVREWISTYWAQLLKADGGRTCAKTLAQELDLDALRARPRLGVRMFEERAADVRLTLKDGLKRAAPANGAGGAAAGGRVVKPGAAAGKQDPADQDLQKLKNPDLLCDHCGFRGHVKSACFVLHPELNPRSAESKLKKAKDRERSRQQGYGAYGYGGQYVPQYMTQFPRQYAQQSTSPGAVNAVGQQGQLVPPPPPPPALPGAPPGVGSPVGGAQIPMPMQMQMPMQMPLPMQMLMPPQQMAGPKQCFKCGQVGHIARNCPN